MVVWGGLVAVGVVLGVSTDPTYTFVQLLSFW